MRRWGPAGIKRRKQVIGSNFNKIPITKKQITMIKIQNYKQSTSDHFYGLGVEICLEFGAWSL